MSSVRLSWVLVVAVGALTAACNKPTSDNCRKALANIQHLMGTDNLVRDADFEGEVRRCQGGSTREAVDCASKATSMAELKTCAFTKTADDSKPKPTDPGPGSGSGSSSGSGSGSAK